MLIANFKFKIYRKKKQRHILVIEFNSTALLVFKTIFFGLIFSCLLFYIPKLYKSSFLNTSVSKQEIRINSHIPLTLRIKSYKQEIPIKEATVSANDWQVFDDAISYLKGSGNISSGNIILYGHNQKEFLGNIIRLGPEDELELTSALGTKAYIVDQVFETSSNDLSALQSKEDLLTIYTCSGWFDINRFFVIAKPASSSAFYQDIKYL